MLDSPDYDRLANFGFKAKIWTTVGDLIQPGYQYPGEAKALRAKETLYVSPLLRLRDSHRRVQ